MQKINREDKWFTEEKKKKTDANIYICSRHFKPECFKTGKFVSNFQFVLFWCCIYGWRWLYFNLFAEMSLLISHQFCTWVKT